MKSEDLKSDENSTTVVLLLYRAVNSVLCVFSSNLNTFCEVNVIDLKRLRERRWFRAVPTVNVDISYFHRCFGVLTPIFGGKLHFVWISSRKFGFRDRNQRKSIIFSVRLELPISSAPPKNQFTFPSTRIVVKLYALFCVTVSLINTKVNILHTKQLQSGGLWRCFCWFFFFIHDFLLFCARCMGYPQCNNAYSNIDGYKIVCIVCYCQPFALDFVVSSPLMLDFSTISTGTMDNFMTLLE